MTTRADVARLAGVAESTVSYVLSGSRPVRPETRERVLAAMAALGYSPNAMARGLASKRSGIIILLLPITERGVHATEVEYIRAVTEAARAVGYQVVLNTMDVAALADLRDVLAPRLFDGAVVMEARVGDPRVAVLQAANLPFAVIGRTGDDVPYVDSDFAAGGTTVVEHLAGLGHREIALLSQPRSMVDLHYGPVERIEASMRATSEALGVQFSTIYAGQSLRAGYEAFDRLVSDRPGVTGLASINEPATMGMIMAARERGRRVPDDLSVVALGISQTSAESVVPSLTTVGAPPTALGQRAVGILVDLLNNPDGTHPQELVEMVLTQRESTAAAPST